MVYRYAKLGEYAPPEPNDTTPGLISYKLGTETILLKVLVSFGFWRNLLAKAVLFQENDSDNYYLAVQAGGDEFWTSDIVATHPSTASKLLMWDKAATTFPRYNGAPRVSSMIEFHNYRYLLHTTTFIDVFQDMESWIEENISC